MATAQKDILVESLDEELKAKVLVAYPRAHKIVVSVTYGYSAPGTGCHACTLNSISVPRVYFRDDKGVHVDWTNLPTFIRNDRGEIVTNPEMHRARELAAGLGKHFEGEAYKAMVENIWTNLDYNMFIIGDNLHNTGNTTKLFPLWLIENKVGIVVSSPGIINRCHRQDNHLCQVWIWIPPQATRFAVPAKVPLSGIETIDPDAVVGQAMVNSNGRLLTETKVRRLEESHNDINLVKRAVILSKAEMKPKRRLIKKIT